MSVTQRPASLGDAIDMGWLGAATTARYRASGFNLQSVQRTISSNHPPTCNFAQVSRSSIVRLNTRASEPLAGSGQK